MLPGCSVGGVPIVKGTVVFLTRFFGLAAGAIATLASLQLSVGVALAQADGPVTKGGTLIYLEQQSHTNLYPPAGGFYPNGGVLNQITDKLTYQNPKTLEIEPWIAESWTVNADATEYTFKIRPGVTFSDGTPLDAAAVAKNFDVYGLGDKALKHPVSEVITNYKGSEVIDPLTVKFTFTKPSVGFLQGTSVIGSGLVSLKTLALPDEALGDATKIIGSGPFVVASEVLGRELVLTARKDYKWGPAKLAHQGPPNLDGIKYVVTPEDSVRIGALLAGQAQVIRQVQAYDEKQVQAKNFLIYAPPTRGVNNSVVFRPDSPLVADLARAPGAAACDQRQGDRGDAVLGQLPAGQVDHRLDRAGLRRSLRQAHLRSRTCRQAARRGRLDDGSQGTAPEGRQGTGADGLRIAAAAAEQGDAAARRPAMGQGRREAQRAGRRRRQPGGRQPRPAEDAGGAGHGRARRSRRDPQPVLSDDPQRAPAEGRRQHARADVRRRQAQCAAGRHRGRDRQGQAHGAGRRGAELRDRPGLYDPDLRGAAGLRRLAAAERLRLRGGRPAELLRRLAGARSRRHGPLPDRRGSARLWRSWP